MAEPGGAGAGAAIPLPGAPWSGVQAKAPPPVTDEGTMTLVPGEIELLCPDPESERTTTPAAEAQTGARQGSRGKAPPDD
jgi:hypothetical protein